MDNERNIIDLDLDEIDNSSLEFYHNIGSPYFNGVIGTIEDIVMEDEFQRLRNKFFEKHCQKFDESDEHTLEHMDIFQEYIGIVETYLETQIGSRLTDFNMVRFQTELQEKKDLLEGEIFELLFSFSDFLIFKTLILDYKVGKEDRFNNLGGDLTVTKLPNHRNNN